jgi:UPF0755 protein
MGLSGVSGLLTFVLLGALATVGALAWLLKESRSPGPLAADKVVMIVREDRGIADQLEWAGVIDSALWFNVLTLLDGNRAALKRGEYAFKAGMSMNDIENELLAHRVVMYKLTIPEGLTSEQIVQRLRENVVLVGDVKETPRKGSLMPDTYYFERGDTRLSILARMAKMRTKALEAVSNPARSKDLDFVADGTGGYVFAETFNQHQKNVAHGRQIEKDVKDKLAPDAVPQPAPAIQGSIDPIDPSQFGALVAPVQGQSAPAAILARLSRIGAGRKAEDAALASLVAPGVKSIDEIGGVVTGVNDGPADGTAFDDAGSPGASGTSRPIPSVPLPPAMLADERAREAKYGTAPLASSSAVLGAATPAAPASPQPPTASGRPRIFDASEGTRLDPLLNKTYDLSYAKVVPPMQ